jgi:hypothetical protein
LRTRTAVPIRDPQQTPARHHKKIARDPLSPAKRPAPSQLARQLKNPGPNRFSWIEFVRQGVGESHVEIVAEHNLGRGRPGGAKPSVSEVAPEPEHGRVAPRVIAGRAVETGAPETEPSSQKHVTRFNEGYVLDPAAAGGRVGARGSPVNAA